MISPQKQLLISPKPTHLQHDKTQPKATLKPVTAAVPGIP